MNKHQQFAQNFEDDQNDDFSYFLLDTECPFLVQIVLAFLFLGKYEDHMPGECSCDKDEFQQGVDPNFARAVDIYYHAMEWGLPGLSELAVQEFVGISESIPFAQIIRFSTSKSWLFGDSVDHYALASIISKRAGQVRDDELDEEGVDGLETIWEESGNVSDVLVAGLLKQRTKLKVAMSIIKVEH